MIPENFSEALLRSGKTDRPVPDAKVRAMATIETALSTSVSAAAGGNAAVLAAKTLTTAKVALAAAVVAGAAGLGGGYELARTTQPAVTVGEARAGASAPESAAVASVAPAADRTSAAVMAAAEAPPADVCAAAPTTAPDKCSATTLGGSVTFALRTRCSERSLDVFWVDASCREVFRGIVAPGSTFWQDSWEGHVFRVRDHATHRLVNEISPARVDGAVDREKYWKGARTELPLVVVHEGDDPIPESPVPECTRGGGRAAILHVRNDRKAEPVALMRIDFDCKETGKPQMVAAGTAADVQCSEGHGFRIRDSSGALLQDVIPTMPDTTTYLTIP
ncbi:MAG: beta domain [Labilithrix sp.]|nr:beta domain [Labilithrix sp.]